MKKLITSLSVVCCIVILSFGSCQTDDNHLLPPDTQPSEPTSDVTVYVSNAERTMVFRKTGINFNEGTTAPNNAVILKSNEKYQQMEGFGASVTGAASYNLMKMTAADRAKFLREVFAKDGVGFSYVRVCIGASDFSLSDYTCCDKQGIENFALTSEELNYVIPVLKEILTYNPDLRIMGSPWSCPRWMKVKTKGSSTPHNEWGGGHLNTVYYQDYATYFVKWIQAFEQRGVPIYSITPQNEPLNGNNSVTLVMEWDEERDFVRTALGPKLKAAGLNTKIYAYDHNYNYDGLASQMEYPLKIYDDSEAAAYFAGSAFHNYGGSRSELLNVHNKRPDKGLVFTEASIGEWHDGRNLSTNFVGSVEEGIDLTRKWCQAVIVWNLMLDWEKRPNRFPDPVCFGVVDISMDYKTITRNCQYYQIGHLSKVIKPGAYRIRSEGYSDNYLMCEAFFNTDGSYAFVVLNKANESRPVTVFDGKHSFTYTLPAKAAASIRWK